MPLSTQALASALGLTSLASPSLSSAAPPARFPSQATAEISSRARVAPAPAAGIQITSIGLRRGIEAARLSTAEKVQASVALQQLQPFVDSGQVLDAFHDQGTTQSLLILHRLRVINLNTYWKDVNGRFVTVLEALCSSNASLGSSAYSIAELVRLLSDCGVSADGGRHSECPPLARLHRHPREAEWISALLDAGANPFRPAGEGICCLELMPRTLQPAVLSAALQSRQLSQADIRAAVRVALASADSALLSTLFSSTPPHAKPALIKQFLSAISASHLVPSRLIHGLAAACTRASSPMPRDVAMQAIVRLASTGKVAVTISMRRALNATTHEAGGSFVSRSQLFNVLVRAAVLAGNPVLLGDLLKAGELSGLCLSQADDLLLLAVTQRPPNVWACLQALVRHLQHVPSRDANNLPVSLSGLAVRLGGENPLLRFPFGCQRLHANIAIVGTASGVLALGSFVAWLIMLGQSGIDLRHLGDACLRGAPGTGNPEQGAISTEPSCEQQKAIILLQVPLCALAGCALMSGVSIVQFAKKVLSSLQLRSLLTHLHSVLPPEVSYSAPR